MSYCIVIVLTDSHIEKKGAVDGQCSQTIKTWLLMFPWLLGCIVSARQRVHWAQGPMFLRFKGPIIGTRQESYAGSYVCTHRSSYFLSGVPMFPGSYVPRVLCSQGPIPRVLCSQGLMFPGSYVPRVLCTQGPMFPGSYVPRVLYSRCSVFPSSI